MKRTACILSALGLATALGACGTTERVESLETARTLVTQVEASPRAGVAATYVAEARKALDRANQLYDQGADVEDINHEAQIASTNAQIANEKILTAQARDEIEKGKAERQAVLIEAREHEARQAQARASTLEQELEELRAKPTPRGMVVTLADVLFDTGQSTLKPGAYDTIDRLAEALKGQPDQNVVIEGHTDSVGSEEYNLGLSQRRAEAVRMALVERGVRAEHVRAIGKGETSPVASNANTGGRQQNRRVEIIFPNGGQKVATDVD